MAYIGRNKDVIYARICLGGFYGGDCGGGWGAAATAAEVGSGSGCCAYYSRGDYSDNYDSNINRENHFQCVK